MRRAFVCTIFASLVMAAAPAAWAGAKDFVIYTPGMGGTAQQAKPYLETFFRQLESSIGWPKGSARGEYFEDQKEAVAYIEKSKPGFGLLSPGLYLELACNRANAPDLLAAVVGVTNAASSGRFHVVVKDGPTKSLEELKGKRLTSNHLQNRAFVSRVVFAGKIDADKFFQLKETNSPIKPFKDVDRGEADAALVDDAQLAHMKELPFGKELRVVYSSEPLPPFPVVYFPKVAKPAERDAMKRALLGMCASGGGAQVCKSLQITKFETLDPGAYRPAVQQYCK
jgi:ABC-type phosphate/phosphonate transport system substrate-binding protein